MKVTQDLIDFRDFACNGKELWMSSRGFNGLLNLDIDIKKANYVKGFENTTQNIELHGPVIDTEDKIYFIPSLGSTMNVYNKCSGDITSVYIYPQDVVWHCLSAYLVQNKIVLLPFQTQDIICYDIENEEILTINLWEDEIGMKFSAEGYFFCGCGTVRGEKLYAVSQRNEGIMELNINNMSIIWHHLSGINMAFSTMVDDGKFLWMSANKDKAFVCCDIQKDVIRLFNSFPLDYKYDQESGQPFCNMVDCGREILAVSIRANMSLWINKKTGRITECKMLSQEGIKRMNPNDGEEYRLAKKINKSTVLLVSCKDKAIVKYNWEQKIIERNFIEVTEDIQTGILKTTGDISKKYNIKFIIKEDIIKLAAFLNYINLKSEKQDMLQNIDIEENIQEAKSGNKIFSRIKDSLLK